nr:transcription factor [Sorangium cellulosum]
MSAEARATPAGEAGLPAGDGREREKSAMDRYVSGQVTAFRELYEELAPRLFRYILRRTRDAALAEDLLQQTMLQIHATRHRFAAGSNVSPWAYSLARRVVINHSRKKAESLVDPSSFDDVASTAQSTDESLDASRRSRALEYALTMLPETQRVIVTLIKDDDSSIRGIAEVLGISVNAAKLRRHRACLALRAAISAEHGVEVAPMDDSLLDA